MRLILRSEFERLPRASGRSRFSGETFAPGKAAKLGAGVARPVRLRKRSEDKTRGELVEHVQTAGHVLILETDEDHRERLSRKRPFQRFGKRR